MLTLPDFAAAKGFTVEQLEAFGVRQHDRGVEIPYRNADGSPYARHRLRTALIAKDGSKWSDGDESLIPYGLDHPVPWEKGYAFVVEGETDCWALWTAGKPALGIPGATATSCLQINHLDGADTVYVIQEPGEAGSNFPHRIATRLYNQGFSGEVYAVKLGDAKDPHELWQRDPNAFELSLRRALSDRVLVPRPIAAAKKTTASTRDVVSLSALFAKPRERAKYLIDGMLTDGGVMLLAAKPKAGKSVLARNIMRAVATGGEFLGRKCRKGLVVWVRLEEQIDPFMDDLQAMGIAEFADMILTNEDVPGEDAMAWLTDVVDRHKPALVIVDTWHKMTRVKDINSYAEVNLANEPLMRLREKGVAQIWIHHQNKGIGTGGDDVLGSSALFAACDTLMKVRAEPNDSRIVQTIQRVGENLSETIVTMDAETKMISVAIDRARYRLGIVEQEILEFLNEQPDGASNKADLVASICRRKADILAACDVLEERKLIVLDRDVSVTESHRVQLAVSQQKPKNRNDAEPRGTATGTTAERRGTASELHGTTGNDAEPQGGSGSQIARSSRQFPVGSAVVPESASARFGTLGNAYVTQGLFSCSPVLVSSGGPPYGGPTPAMGTASGWPKNLGLFAKAFSPIYDTAASRSLLGSRVRVPGLVYGFRNPGLGRRWVRA